MTHNLHIIDSGWLQCLSTKSKHKEDPKVGEARWVLQVTEMASYQLRHQNQNPIRVRPEDTIFPRKQGQKATNIYWTAKHAGTGAAFVLSHLIIKNKKVVGY